MKNMNEIAKAVTLAEGKKKSVSIAQVKEILGIVSELTYRDGGVMLALYANGRKRAMSKVKGARKATTKR